MIQGKSSGKHGYIKEIFFLRRDTTTITTTKNNETVFTVANVQQGKPTADIRAGTGLITEGLVQRSLKVIAVDQSEAMIRETEKEFHSVDTNQNEYATVSIFAASHKK